MVFLFCVTFTNPERGDSHTFIFFAFLCKDEQGMNPAHCATFDGHVHIFELMLQLNCYSTEIIEI